MIKRPSRELSALRRAVDTYLRVVLVDDADNRAHDMDETDAAAMEMLRDCLSCDIARKGLPVRRM
jgi:hypothetical protein